MWHTTFMQLYVIHFCITSMNYFSPPFAPYYDLFQDAGLTGTVQTRDTEYQLEALFQAASTYIKLAEYR